MLSYYVIYYEKRFRTEAARVGFVFSSIKCELLRGVKCNLILFLVKLGALMREALK